MAKKQFGEGVAAGKLGREDTGAGELVVLTGFF